MSQRLVLSLLCPLTLTDEHLAVDERAPPLERCLFAIAFGGEPVLGGQQALLGHSCMLVGSASAPFCATSGGLLAPYRVRIVIQLVEDVGLRNREITCGGGLVSCQCRDIAVVGARITFVGSLEPTVRVGVRGFRRRAGDALPRFGEGLVRAFQRRIA